MWYHNCIINTFNRNFFYFLRWLMDFYFLVQLHLFTISCLRFRWGVYNYFPLKWDLFRVHAPRAGLMPLNALIKIFLKIAAVSIILIHGSSTSCKVSEHLMSSLWNISIQTGKWRDRPQTRPIIEDSVG